MRRAAGIGSRNRKPSRIGRRGRLLAAAIVAGLVAAAVAGQVRSPGGGSDISAVAEGPLLALARDGSQRVLVAVDPLSLRPLPGSPRLPVQAVEGWARSPRGTRMAIVTRHGSRLRFVDAREMRATGRFALGARGVVALVAWPRADRLWLVLVSSGCCARGTTTVLTVDPVRQRVVARTRLAAALTRVAATPDGPVMLLAPRAAVGVAVLATVGVGGRVDEIPLDGVSAGAQRSEGVVTVLRTRRPGLAVDPDRRRAYVLSGRPYVLEVDLRARRVHHHGLTPRRSIGDRLRDLLEARAEAQPIVGPEHSAAWLAPRYIAVSGRNARVSWRPGGAIDEASRPSGLQVIDTDAWQVHTVDPGPDRFHAANAQLLITTRGGLEGYGPDGRRRFRLLEGRRVAFVGAAGPLAYVRTDAAASLTIVDLARGRVIGTGPDPSPLPLAERGHGPWE